MVTTVGMCLFKGGAKFPRKYGPGTIWKFGPGGNIFWGAIFPVARVQQVPSRSLISVVVLGCLNRSGKLLCIATSSIHVLRYLKQSIHILSLSLISVLC